MTLITFTSDFGLSDHYVAQTKARILKGHPEAQIIDISHEIKPFNLAHMAYVLQSTFREFPKGTIHLVGNDNTAQGSNSYVIVNIEDHIFVGPNNGVLSLVCTRPPTFVYEINSEPKTGFIQLTEIVAKLAKGATPDTLGTVTDEFTRYVARKARATKKEIAGQVIHIDHYGNLITNIEAPDFEILSINKTYHVTFGRDSVKEINNQISDVEPGEVFIIFNLNEKLMLGINQGHGAQLLGLEYDSPIFIRFDD